MKKKILILGGNGFIGQNITNLFANCEFNQTKYSIISTTKKQIDVLQKEKLDDFFREIRHNDPKLQYI